MEFKQLTGNVILYCTDIRRGAFDRYDVNLQYIGLESWCLTKHISEIKDYSNVTFCRSQKNLNIISIQGHPLHQRSGGQGLQKTITRSP